MRALTLHQPWASLIASGDKSIETRSWAPPPGLVGQRIAIHAGHRVVRGALTWGTRQAIAALYGPEWPSEIPTGVILCTAKLVSVRRVTGRESGRATLSPCIASRGPPVEVDVDPRGDFDQGRWMWLLDQVEALDPPVPAVGHQGLWEWDP